MIPKERDVTLTAGAEQLEARFIAGGGNGSGAVIAPPHPLYGGSLDNPVVTELAHAFFRLGIPTLRFNWRGVGASTGVPTSDADAAMSDYGAALQLLRADSTEPAVLCGYSFGAVTALRLAARGVEAARLVLVAPPPALLDDVDPASIAHPVRILVGVCDDVAPMEQLAQWCERLPDARLEVLPGANHFFSGGSGLDEVRAFVEPALKLDPVVLELDI